MVLMSEWVTVNPQTLLLVSQAIFIQDLKEKSLVKMKCGSNNFDIIYIRNPSAGILVIYLILVKMYPTQ